MSVFPVIPGFPIVAWGMVYVLDLIHPQAGIVIVGGGHVVILSVMLISIAKSLLVMRSKTNS